MTIQRAAAGQELEAECPPLPSEHTGLAAGQPLVSVIIPVFNRAHFLPGAMQSILRQTVVDLELIVVDDGSADPSAAVASSIPDRRARLVAHGRNLGIPAARNTGLEHARGKFIAWLDSDDLARPTRLEEQLRYLRRHPEVAMVGCCAGRLNEAGHRKKGIRVPPLAPDDIRAWLLFRSAFQQSSIMGRAEVLKAYAYRSDYPVCEDVDVFLRVAESHRVGNIPKVLIDRRMHSNQTIHLQQEKIRDRKASLFPDRLAKLGMTFTRDDIGRHVLLGNPKGFHAGPEFLQWAEAWLLLMRQANRRSRYLDERALRFTSSYFWLLACRAAIPEMGRLRTMRRWAASALAAGLAASHGRNWLLQALPLAPEMAGFRTGGMEAAALPH